MRSSFLTVIAFANLAGFGTPPGTFMLAPGRQGEHLCCFAWFAQSCLVPLHNIHRVQYNQSLLKTQSEQCTCTEQPFFSEFLQDCNAFLRCRASLCEVPERHLLGGPLGGCRSRVHSMRSKSRNCLRRQCIREGLDG